MRFIESDDSLSLRGAQVIEAIATDKKQNLIPFFVSISRKKNIEYTLHQPIESLFAYDMMYWTLKFESFP